MWLRVHPNLTPASSSSSSSSSTFIDNKESYKQISCVEHFDMRSNIFKNIFVFCKKHDFLLQKGTMKQLD